MTLARYQFNVQDESGNVVNDVTITVRRETPGYPLVPLFSDREGTISLGNGFLATDGANVGFHVIGGAYWIRAEKPGFSRDWHYVGIGTNSESDFGSQFLPRGAWSSVVSYDLLNLVEHFGATFISNESGNLNNEPVTSPVPASDTHWTYNGGQARYDVVVWDVGRPASGETLVKVDFTTNAVFRAGLLESRGSADVAATGSSVFSLQKNGIEFGTATFSAAGTVAAYAAAADITFEPGDVLGVVAPNPRDATLSGVALTITGYR